MKLLTTALVSSLLTVGIAVTVSNGVSARKDPIPEEVVEKSILAYGSRAAIYGIQRNGILRALVKFISPEGTREGKSVVKFIRKEKLVDDLRMLDLELPGTNYAIGYDGKEIWSVFNNEIRQPAPQEVNPYKSSHANGYEALLRYKENGAKLEYAGTTNLGTLDLDLIDMISADGRRTRYEISRRSFRIIYINYEDKADEDSEPVKYRLYFKDFRVIQNCLVPYVTMVFQNGKLIEERTIVEAVFNVQLDDKDFLAENYNKQAETSPGR